MLATVEIIAKVMLFGIVMMAPLLYFFSRWKRRDVKRVVISWRATPVVGITILFFMLCLSICVLGSFALAVELERIESAETPFFVNHSPIFWLLAAVLGLLSISLYYLGLRNLLTQFITEQGVHLLQYNLSTGRFNRQLIRWEQIRDFYLRRDGPVTYFTFMVGKPGGGFERHTLRVPHQYRMKLEAVLDRYLAPQFATDEEVPFNLSGLSGSPS